MAVTIIYAVVYLCHGARFAIVYVVFAAEDAVCASAGACAARALPFALPAPQRLLVQLAPFDFYALAHHLRQHVGVGRYGCEANAV